MLRVFCLRVTPRVSPHSVTLGQKSDDHTLKDIVVVLKFVQFFLNIKFVVGNIANFARCSVYEPSSSISPLEYRKGRPIFQLKFL